jgi:VWFA-related protein
MPLPTRRLRLFPTVFVCLAALLSPPLAGTGTAQAPQAPPTFPSGVELITVDAVVLDRHGRPVPGLTRDDFVVKEEGREQEIVSFEAFDVGAVSEEPEVVAPAVVASNLPRGTGRAFAIVLDDLGIAPERIPAARETAGRLLERFVRDGDLVTVATTSGDAWWSARVPEGREDLVAVLARARGRRVDVRVEEWMTEYEAFWIAHHEDSPSVTSLVPGTGVTLPGRASASAAPEAVPPGSIKERVKQRWQRANWCLPIYCDSLVRARAAELDGARRTRVRLALACVRRALEALAPVRGRKSLLLLSEGFLEDSGSDSRAVAAASREANTAVYFVDVRGLVALAGWGSAADSGPPPDERERTAVAFEERAVESAGAAGLADDTGGFTVRNTNDLSAGVWRIAAESRVFYLLGFYPPEGKAPRQWRKLRVEVKRPGLTVRARRGYTLRSEMASAWPGESSGDESASAASPTVLRALDSAHDETGIPLRAIAYVQEPRPGDLVHVLVAAELDAATVAASAASGVRLEIGAQAAMRDSGQVFRQDAAVTIAGAEGEGPAWRAFTRDFELPPGVAQVRLVVRDPASGATGSIQHRLEIPFPGEMRVSTPILTDRVLPAESPDDGPRPALAAHRVFPGGGGLYCQYEVFGAASPGGTPPRVAAGLQIRSSNGTVLREAVATPITPDRRGRVVRLVGASLEGLPEGSYELVIDVRDERTGEQVVRHEAFALVRPGG